ncbi:MAG: trehalose-phosphatase [Candidatus Aadella gelida]|nr:trehalose-phosphatase [Candidatus Aadella gelida]
MKNFLKEWDKTIKKQIEGYIYVFLDFDGTITPIKKYPKGVILSSIMKKVVEDLSMTKDISVSIISGRELSEIKKMVGIKNIGYVGNHGLESEDEGLKHTIKEALKTEPLMRKINKELRTSLRSFKGIIVENKGLSLSVHYRTVKEKDVKKAKKVFSETVRMYKNKRRIKVGEGKKVWEIRPPMDKNKGTAVLDLLRKKEKAIKKTITPIYIGDDKTDEDAFRVFKKRGYTVKVCKENTKNTYARFYLRNTAEVKKVLENIVILKKREECHV